MIAPRHQLALLYERQGRQAEAEAEWRQTLQEQPAFAPAWFGLAELLLGQKRWSELEALAGELEKQASLANEADVLRARAHLARQEFTPARELLEAVIARQPQAVHPRIILSHVLLQEHRDLATAERVLRELLELDSRQAESWRNLAILFREQGRGREALEACLDQQHPRLATERQLACQKLVKDYAQAIDVAPGIDLLDLSVTFRGRKSGP